MSLSPRLQPFKTLFSAPAVRSAIAAVAPPYLGADQVIAATLVQLGHEPELLDCDPRAVLFSVLQATQLGLEIGGPTAQVYLRPKGRRCRLGFGYRGRLQAATRAGARGLQARVVREGDDFEVVAGDAPRLHHRPKHGGGRQLVAVYAIAWPANASEPIWELMTREEVDEVKAQAQGELVETWLRGYEEQARKAVLRRLCDYLPARLGAVDPEAAPIDLDVDAILGVAELEAVPVELAPQFAAAVEPVAEEQLPPQIHPEEPVGNPTLLTELLRQVAAARRVTQLNPVAVFAQDAVLTEEERRAFQDAYNARRAEIEGGRSAA